MSNVIEWIMAGTLVIVVLVATYAISNAWSRRRVEQDFKDPEDILTAAAVYVKYKRQRAAIDLLQAGLERHPGNVKIREMLEELSKSSTVGKG